MLSARLIELRSKLLTWMLNSSLGPSMVSKRVSSPFQTVELAISFGAGAHPGRPTGRPTAGVQLGQIASLRATSLHIRT